MKTIRIGGGAGYAGDRIEPAIELMEKGDLDYIIFECLAERTIAIGQQDKARNSRLGYNQLLEWRMKKVLPLAKKNHIKVITNMGAANPISAMEKSVEIAKQLGITGLKFAAVTGDDIFDELENYYGEETLETQKRLGTMKEDLISANVYMGADGIIEALEHDADIIITGRVSDPALSVGPLVYEFRWNMKEHPGQMGQAILAGHLLECAGQITGGYYADPGFKEVPDLYKLGFPLIEIAETGELVVTKTEGSGGIVCEDTCKEQLVYEIHNPKAYLTPDAIADFSAVTFTQIGENKVKAEHATTHGRPETLKVSIGYKDCFIGEGEISYGGENCLKRARLAAEIVEKRVDITEIKLTEFRTDFIGYDSLYREKLANQIAAPVLPEVRLRMSGRSKDKIQAERLTNEIETLYTNGPAGGGGVTKKVSEIVSVCSIFVPRDIAAAKVDYLEV